MKRLFENWRGYLNENLSSLKHISADKWKENDARQEWVEEIKPSLESGDSYIGQRWPGLTKEGIERDYPFLLTAEAFAEALITAKDIKLSPSEVKLIHNHAQVYDIIEMYENNKTSAEVKEKMTKFFSKFKTDPNAQGETFAKEESYLRWVEYFEKSDNADKPPIIIKMPNGSYAHIGGQTRQTGALTNGKIIPYAVLTPARGSDETTD